MSVVNRKRQDITPTAYLRLDPGDFPHKHDFWAWLVEEDGWSCARVAEFFSRVGASGHKRELSESAVRMAVQRRRARLAEAHPERQLLTDRERAAIVKDWRTDPYGSGRDLPGLREWLGRQPAGAPDVRTLDGATRKSPETSGERSGKPPHPRIVEGVGNPDEDVLPLPEGDPAAFSLRGFRRRGDLWSHLVHDCGWSGADIARLWELDRSSVAEAVRRRRGRHIGREVGAGRQEIGGPPPVSRSANRPPDQFKVVADDRPPDHPPLRGFVLRLRRPAGA